MGRLLWRVKRLWRFLLILAHHRGRHSDIDPPGCAIAVMDFSLLPTFRGVGLATPVDAAWSNRR